MIVRNGRDGVVLLEVLKGITPRIFCFIINIKLFVGDLLATMSQQVNAIKKRVWVTR